jgi:hypothetical protein
LHLSLIDYLHHQYRGVSRSAEPLPPIRNKRSRLRSEIFQNFQAAAAEIDFERKSNFHIYF